MDACILRQRKDDERGSETASQVAETAKSIVKTCRNTVSSTASIVSHESLPEWMKDNDFLVHGHRTPMPSFRHCFRTIFHVHTETGNIWTHLFGFALVSLIAAFSFCQSRFGSGHFWSEKFLIVRELPGAQQAMFGLFFTGALLALLGSSLFHTLLIHSHKVNKIFSRLDYAGISVLIVSCNIPAYYYTFFCYPNVNMFYSTAMILCGVACIIVFFSDELLTYRTFKGILFAIFGLLGVIPMVHSVYLEGHEIALKQSGLVWLILMAVAYLSGASLYVSRIPERFLPGKCDIYGQSHQIFHINVIFGILFFYWGLLSMAEYRHATGTCQ